MDPTIYGEPSTEPEGAFEREHYWPRRPTQAEELARIICSAFVAAVAIFGLFTFLTALARLRAGFPG